MSPGMGSIGGGGGRTMASGNGVDGHSVALHVKVLYFLIVVLILGEIGAYYYSLYLFRSLQEDCVACIVGQPTATSARYRAGSGEDDRGSDSYLGEVGYANGGDRDWRPRTRTEEASRAVVTGPPIGSVRKAGHLAESEDDFEIDPYAAAVRYRDVHRDRHSHDRRREGHRLHITDDDDGNGFAKKQELGERDDDETMVFVEEDMPVNSRHRRRKRRKAAPKGEAGQEKFVWLKASSQIPIEQLHSFCNATKEYCPKNSPGPTGPKGNHGDKGDKGEQGDLGYPGDPGPSGNPGLPGSRGSKGDTGSPGLDGLEGIPGAPGLDGVPGIDGLDGRPGINGIPGNPGIPGRSGTNGTNGIPGSQGPPGSIGPKGTPGLSGAKGKRGSDGRPGEPGIPGISAWKINGTKDGQLLVPPVISDTDIYKVIIIKEREHLRMRCSAFGQPPPEITWRREDNHPFRNGSRHETLFVGNTIELYNVHREHMGRYLCMANNGVPPMAKGTYTLEVTFRPYIEVANDSVGTVNGSYAVLRCHIEAFPVSINDWLMEDGSRIAHSWKYNISIIELGYKVDMTLNITNIGPRDYSIYKCISRNELGETVGTVAVYPKLGRDGGSQMTIHGQVPPEHVSVENLCPKCPHCTPPEVHCPDTGSAANVKIHNFTIMLEGIRDIGTLRTKSCELGQVGKPVYKRLTNALQGTWMMDLNPASHHTIRKKFWATTHNDTSTLYEYANETYFIDDNVSQTYELPYAFEGSGHVIYNGSFYYHKNGTAEMVRYNLVSQEIVTKALPETFNRSLGLLYTSKYHYMDFCVDENGLWVIYGFADSNNTFILKFNSFNLQHEMAWSISLNHRTVGEMFIICGILYVVDTVSQWHTKIRFTFDFYLLEGRDVDINFTNPYRSNTMIGYKQVEPKEIYSWDGGHQLSYPLRITNRGGGRSSMENEVETPNNTT